jgi:type II secretory ATPase GspE/PulE/Tfp pilus assembly ATPase PilB-like protein
MNIPEPNGPATHNDTDQRTSGVRVNDPVIGWLLTHAVDLGATSVYLVEEQSKLRVLVRVDRKLRETTVLPTSAGNILLRRVLSASGIKLDAAEPQRGAIPSVPGRREEWLVRSQPGSPGRLVILKPAKPPQPPV